MLVLIEASINSGIASIATVTEESLRDRPAVTPKRPSFYENCPVETQTSHIKSHLYFTISVIIVSLKQCQI